jgi:hypothetical protein
MADKKISALTSATTPLAGTEVLPIVQSGATVKVAVSDLTAGRAVSASSFAGPLNGTVGATTPASGSFTTLVTTGQTIIGTDLLVGSATNDSGSWRAYVLASNIQGAVYFETPVSSGNTISKFVRSASDGTAIAFSRGGGDVGSVSITTLATLYNTTSDQRLKENIQDAASASDLIDSLQVRQYNWKSDGSHQRYGFVAQELVNVAPEAVYQPANPDEMMAVDYSKLVPMLVKEIQNLRKRVATLESA